MTPATPSKSPIPCGKSVLVALCKHSVVLTEPWGRTLQPERVGRNHLFYLLWQFVKNKSISNQREISGCWRGVRRFSEKAVTPSPRHSESQHETLSLQTPPFATSRHQRSTHWRHIEQQAPSQVLQRRWWTDETWRHR